MKIRTLIKAYTITALSIISLANAATWTGNGDGVSWSDQNNWDTQIVPNKDTAAAIGDSAYVNFTDGNYERSADTVLSGNSTLILANRRFLHANSANATMTISDNAVLTQNGNYFIVGQTAAGIINQTGGILNSTVDRGFFMTDRNSAGGTEYNLTGGELNVNYYDSSTAFHFELLGRDGANATFLVDGGEAHFNVLSPGNRSLHILNGGSPIFQVDSGLAEFTGFRNFVIGNSGDHNITDGLASVIVNGGVMTIETVNNGAVIIGDTGGQGTIKVNGGTLTHTGTTGIIIGANSTGTMEQTGGIVSTEGNIILGTQANSYYMMDGGELSATDIVLSENADASVRFIFNSGMITLDGDRSTLVNETWFEATNGVFVDYDAVNDATTIAFLPYAHNPSPAVGEADAGEIVDAAVTVSLSWDTGWETATPGEPNPEIVKHSLYMSKNTTDPNLYYVDEVAAGNPVAVSASYQVSDLDLDGKYYWRVDEELSNGSTIAGRKWYFETPKSIPLFTTQPENMVVSPEETAEFMVEVSSVSSVSYTWYKSIDDEVTPTTDQVIGTDSNSLTISNVSDSDEGYYYCEVTNGGGSVFSNVVSLGVARKVIHWTLNESDFVNDMYVDITGNGHDVDPNGAPTFSDGVVNGDKNDTDPVTGGAVTITEGTGWGNAGSYDPSEFTDMFTISAWVNLTGVDEIENGMIVSKRSAWNAGQSAWIFMINKNGQLRFQAHSSTTLNAPEGMITKNTWHHVVAAYADGYARLYIDGAQVAQGSFQPSIGSNSTFWIGRNEALNERFDGMLDDIQVYNYDLDQENIIDIYHKESGKYLCIYDQPGDINSDCEVDLEDIATVAAHWLENGFYPLDYTKN